MIQFTGMFLSDTILLIPLDRQKTLISWLYETKKGSYFKDKDQNYKKEILSSLTKLKKYLEKTTIPPIVPQKSDKEKNMLLKMLQDSKVPLSIPMKKIKIGVSCSYCSFNTYINFL